MRALLVPLLLLVTVAGCPRRGGGGGGGPAVRAGAGCPAAQSVYIASYLAREDGAKEGHTGWVLPLLDKQIPAVGDAPEYEAIDAAAASAAGVPAAPRAVWLLSPQGGAPCKATIGSYYAAAIDGPRPNLTYGVELSGCAAPPDASDASAIVLAYDGAVDPAPPTDCKVMPPRLVAARLGETDAQGKWSRPAKETPIPPAFAKIVSDRPCAPPGCEKLWSIAQVEVGGKPVAWAGAVNWLTIPEGAGPDQQCTWKAESFSGFFTVGPDGAPAKVTEAQEHPLILSAVLADSGGAKVMIAVGPGEYTTYDLAAGQARVGRHLVWLVGPPEAYTAIDQLGPECERR